MFTIYSTPACPTCKQVKALLQATHQTYEEVNVMESPEARQKFVEWNVRAVPQVVHNQVLIGGINELKEYLEVENEG